MEIFITLTVLASGAKKLTAACGDYLVYFRYLLLAPPNGQVWHKALLSIFSRGHKSVQPIYEQSNISIIDHR